MLILNIVSWMLVSLAVVVFIDAKLRKVECAGRWALKMLVNPFALRKYFAVRNNK